MGPKSICSGNQIRSKVSLPSGEFSVTIDFRLFGAEKPNVWQVLQEFYRQRLNSADEAKVRGAGAGGTAGS